MNWEHFSHHADVGIRGFGSTPQEAFINSAIALTAVVTDPEQVQDHISIRISGEAISLDLLLFEWLNRIIYEMDVRSMVFSSFTFIRFSEQAFNAIIKGESLDLNRHHPAVGLKGATMSELKVIRAEDSSWIAQCIVDV